MDRRGTFRERDKIRVEVVTSATINQAINELSPDLKDKVARLILSLHPAVEELSRHRVARGVRRATITRMNSGGDGISRVDRN